MRRLLLASAAALMLPLAACGSSAGEEREQQEQGEEGEEEDGEGEEG
jgi:hypothetical protein